MCRPAIRGDRRIVILAVFVDLPGSAISIANLTSTGTVHTPLENQFAGRKTGGERPMPVAQSVIDPHHHLWDLGRNKYPWLQERLLAPRLEGDIRPIAEDYLLKDYLSDVRNHNVVKSVHVECGWDPSNPVGETEWLQGMADKHGFPHGIVARVTLDAPDVEQVLEGHACHKNVRGIRHAINWHPDPQDLRNRPLGQDGRVATRFALLRRWPPCPSALPRPMARRYGPRMLTPTS